MLHFFTLQFYDTHETKTFKDGQNEKGVECKLYSQIEKGFIPYLNSDSCEESQDGKSHVRWDEGCGKAQNEDGDMGDDMDWFSS